jgi:3-deoxy-D-manno-octulosonic-acid transferase
MGRFFFKKVLHNFDCLSMASRIDSDRIKMIGAPVERIFITGNSKFDTLACGTSPLYEKEMREKLNIGDVEDVFIAASIHPGENELIIRSYKRLLRKFPGLILIIAPRHTKRVTDIEKLLKTCGFSSYFYSEKCPREKGNHIIIVDTIGELFKIYSVGTIVFCGGSLVPKGGQNILEPAAWGKIVLYGPSMEDFLEGKELLEGAGAGFVVRSVDEIVSISEKFLKAPQERKLRGEAGREAILKRGGAAFKNAEMVKYLIEKGSASR